MQSFALTSRSKISHVAVSAVWLLIVLHTHVKTVTLKGNIYGIYDKVIIIYIPLHAGQALAVVYTCDTSSTTGDNPVPMTSFSHLHGSKVKG